MAKELEEAWAEGRRLKSLSGEDSPAVEADLLGGAGPSSAPAVPPAQYLESLQEARGLLLRCLCDPEGEAVRALDRQIDAADKAREDAKSPAQLLTCAERKLAHLQEVQAKLQARRKGVLERKAKIEVEEQKIAGKVLDNSAPSLRSRPRPRGAARSIPESSAAT